MGFGEETIQEKKKNQYLVLFALHEEVSEYKSAVVSRVNVQDVFRHIHLSTGILPPVCGFAIVLEFTGYYIIVRDLVLGTC